MKNFVLLLAIFWTATAGLSAETTAEQPEGWSDGNDGKISNLAELRWLSETTEAWDEDWILTADIDATETQSWNVGNHDGDDNTPDEPMGFSPIGNSSNKFTGFLNGDGFVK